MSIQKLISTQVSPKTGTVIRKYALEGGAEMTRVFYGQGTPLWRKGINRMEVTNYHDGEKIFDYFGVGKGNKLDAFGDEFLGSLSKKEGKSNKGFLKKLKNIITKAEKAANS